MLSAYFFRIKNPPIFAVTSADFYTKYHLKFGKNQADDLVAVFNRFI